MTATVTYRDASDAQQTAQASVTATVRKVFSLTLTGTDSVLSGKGTTVTFAYTLTNTGNYQDTFNLAAADVASGDSGNFDTGSIKIFIDADGDGSPDNANGDLDVHRGSGGRQLHVRRAGGNSLYGGWPAPPTS